MSLATETTTTTTTTASDKFDHLFEGWSVWIEPDEEEAATIVEEIKSLSKKCGGAECGVYPFVPHCTLLYNISPITNASDDSSHSREKGEQLLYKCVETFRQSTHQRQEDDTAHDDDKSNHALKLIPTSVYYFAYPKHADNGKGFGCVISLLLLKETTALQELHAAVTASFPQDERQSNFVPHMSLVYAPENRAPWLQEYTKNQKQDEEAPLLKPLRAKYLSLWSTKGRVHEWYRIARIQL